MTDPRRFEYDDRSDADDGLGFRLVGQPAVIPQGRGDYYIASHGVQNVTVHRLPLAQVRELRDALTAHIEERES